MSLCNNYSLKIAKEQRPCFICGKFSNSVLDSSDDFFFICLSHTKDSGFCTVSEVVEDSKESEQLTEEPATKVYTYKLHRSILFLREDFQRQKEKLNLLKSLK